MVDGQHARFGKFYCRMEKDAACAPSWPYMLSAIYFQNKTMPTAHAHVPVAYNDLRHRADIGNAWMISKSDAPS